MREHLRDGHGDKRKSDLHSEERVGVSGWVGWLEVLVMITD